MMNRINIQKENRVQCEILLIIVIAVRLKM